MDLGWGAAGWPEGLRQRRGHPRLEVHDPWWAYVIAALYIPVGAAVLWLSHRLLGSWILAITVDFILMFTSLFVVIVIRTLISGKL